MEKEVWGKKFVISGLEDRDNETESNIVTKIKEVADKIKDEIQIIL